MKTRRSLLLLCVLSVCACDNRRANFDKEFAACEAAQRLGHLASAELACGRALAIADSADFSPPVRSQTLYGLGRIKRQLSKFAEAEQLQRQALLIEEQRDNPESVEIGRRLIEVSINLAGQNRWSEGAQVLVRLLPLADQLTGKVCTDAANVLRQYARQLATSGHNSLAERFESKATALQMPAAGAEAAPNGGQDQGS